MPEVQINPKSVAITAGQTQEFKALQDDGQRIPVQWSIEPSKGAGKIEDDSGVYSAPKWILRSRKAVIVARPAGGGAPSTAVVELVPLSFWIQFLGFYLLFSFLLLLGVLVREWKDFCPTCKPDAVRVSPPVVTLTPSASQSFAANVPVIWSNNVQNKLQDLALYTAPKTIPPGGAKAQITARMLEAPKRSGTAEVFLSPDGSFFLQPAKATIRAGGSVDLTAVPSPPPAQGAAGTSAPAVDWMKPELGTLTPVSPTGSVPGNATARFSIEANAVDHPVTVLVLARMQGATTRIAGSWVTVLPASVPPGTCGDGCGSDVAALIRLIAFLGALGGLIHGISSFTTFVGNREFVASWIWWYVFKPFLGALVALVVFLVFRAGFGGSDLSLGAADCLKVAAFAGLIGLFAEPATLKLRDIFETLFTPRNDPRRDAAGAVRPVLQNLTPTTLTEGQTNLPPLTINGTGFSSDCQVKVGGGDLRKPTTFSPTQLVITLQDKDAEKAGTLEVIVYNKPPNGDPSNALQIVVNKKTDAAGASGTPGAGGGTGGGGEGH